MIKSIVIFILAGLAEIGGGYLVWLWLREGKPLYWGIFGGLILALYGVIATFQSFPSFGRVYAAYGGVFIVLSILWGWGIDRKTPDLYDWIGAGICLFGATVILFAPRQKTLKNEKHLSDVPHFF
ncbi:YnfA family protein [Neobacillus citreus]|uniref:YnfA family protein n=1 Tax=Neobacillus citreus TaxID=2833578 RepID=A0A942T633_9BACI|nr:YnfA family protein [Neobacillus citreus]MCH6267737.1 YnfA family protein [Neobacillus citreus]